MNDPMRWTDEQCATVLRRWISVAFVNGLLATTCALLGMAGNVGAAVALAITGVALQLML